MHFRFTEQCNILNVRDERSVERNAYKNERLSVSSENDVNKSTGNTHISFIHTCLHTEQTLQEIAAKNMGLAYRKFQEPQDHQCSIRQHKYFTEQQLVNLHAGFQVSCAFSQLNRRKPLKKRLKTTEIRWIFLPQSFMPCVTNRLPPCLVRIRERFSSRTSEAVFSWYFS